MFIRKFKDDTKSEEAEDADNEIKADKEEDADNAEETDKSLKYRLTQSTLQSEQLIGHIIATKTNAFNVSDSSMEIPELDSYGRIVSPTNDPRGHHEEGRTIAIHSVVVDPDYQGQAIGTTLLKDYIQRMSTLKHADRFALLAHERLIPFYERVGFESKGVSECKFSGGGWYDLQAPLVADD
jgi:ribosomal protein S18 acetylase RimI-like enzyme